MEKAGPFRLHFVFRYSFFFVAWFHALNYYCSAIAEDLVADQSLSEELLKTKKTKQGEHPWVERAIALGFEERFALHDLPIRAWVRQGQNQMPAPDDIASSDIENYQRGDPIGAPMGESILDRQSVTYRKKHFVVMIESDGASWKSAGYLSPRDPTPIEPIGLMMALLTPVGDHVLYLARPCQFSKPDRLAPRACEDNRWWTSWRFSSEIVQTYHRIILRYATEFPDNKIVLAGFSGGGSLAALIAARIAEGGANDSLCLITMASPLDLNEWTNHHRLSLLKGLPDATSLKQSLIGLPAAYAFGVADRKVPFESAGVFLSEPAWIEKVHKYKDLKHNADWVKLWPELLRKAC